jgi:hypothetical protein
MNYVLTRSEYTTQDDIMFSEQYNERDVAGGSVASMRYYSGKCLERLKKPTTILSQDSQSSSLDLNVGPPDYEAGTLNIPLRHSSQT